MLHISTVIARERTTGLVVSLVLVGSLGGGVPSPEYSDLHESFRANTPEGAALRTKYSDVLFYIDNHLAQSYEFPDPSKQAEEELRNKLAAARTLLESRNAELQSAQVTVEKLQATIAAAAEAEQTVIDLEVQLGLRKSPEEELREELKALTVPELKARCEEENVATTGLHSKQDFIDALIAAETSADQ